MYEIVLDRPALRALQKLPLDLRRRILAKLALAKEEPHRQFERLAGRADHKLRVGDYRIIADINIDANRIEVTLIGHRSKVYKKRK